MAVSAQTFAGDQRFAQKTVSQMAGKQQIHCIVYLPTFELRCRNFLQSHYVRRHTHFKVKRRQRKSLGIFPMHSTFFSLSLSSRISLADNFLFHQHSRKERGWKEKRLMYYYSFLQCHRFRLRFDQIARNRMREKVTASIIFKNRKASYPKR